MVVTNAQSPVRVVAAEEREAAVEAPEGRVEARAAMLEAVQEMEVAAAVAEVVKQAVRYRAVCGLQGRRCPQEGACIASARVIEASIVQ